MSDTTINRFVASGTAAQRVAFTPAPATPASGPSPLCIWYETDTGFTYESPNAGAWVRTTDILPWKPNCRAKTTGALAANTYANGTAGVGATLTANGNGALAAQDGVTLAAGERLLVANEAAGLGNGIYVVTQVGTGSLPYILTRATDADSGAELVNATVKISEGTVSADQDWQCTTNATIVVGTTALVWSSNFANLSTSLSQVSSSLSGAISSTTSLSSAVSTVISGSISTVTSSVNSLSTAIGGGGGGGGLVLITETVTSASAASVTFSSIAATYRDLLVMVRGRGDAVAAQVAVRLQFNTDTATNYEWEQLNFQGVTNFTGGTTTVAQIEPGVIPGASARAAAAGTTETIIADYRGTTFHKAASSICGAQAGSSGTTMFVIQAYGLWRSTAAITAVKVFLGSGNFVDNSVVSLYGRM